MEVALKREASLAHGTKIDQYMDVDACEVLERRVEKSKQREINALNKNDPEYAKKVEDIEKRAKLTKYKAMKTLNTGNEKVPVRVKNEMVRRASQLP